MNKENITNLKILSVYLYLIIASKMHIYIVSRSLQLRLKHILHSSFEKSIIERDIEYVNDRTEGFDD